MSQKPPDSGLQTRDQRPADDAGDDDARPFGGWRARQRTTQEAAERRARRVRQLRIALPALALVLVGVFALSSQLRGIDEEFAAQFSNLDSAEDVLRTESPRFYGSDNDGLGRFELTANSAVQNPDTPDVVTLAAPKAVAASTEDGAVTVTAPRGVYQTKSNILDLTDGVRVAYSSGDDRYVLNTSAARVSLRDKTVNSLGRVEGQGPAGSMEADHMSASKAGDQLVFEGNVRMVLLPSVLLKKPSSDAGKGTPQ